MSFGFGFNRLGGLVTGLGGVVAQAIKWLLPFNLNGTATIPNDGTGDVTDNYSGTDARYPRVWDETSGLVLSPVYGKAFISEGMRISCDTDEASLGSELWDDEGVTVQSGWADNGDGTYTGTSTTGLIYDTSVESVQGNQTYSITFTVDSISAGSVRLFMGGGTSIYGTARATTGTYTEVVNAPTSPNNNIGIDALTTFSGTVSNISFKLVTPAFLNSVSKVDSTKLHPSATKTDADGNSYEVMLQHEPRTNAESVTSEDYRYTGDADPHNFWYQNQTLASPATTSLVSPLRDSEGRYYEELVKNGGFDVDAEWTKGTGWTISGGVATHTGGGDNLKQTTSTSTDSYYKITFTVSSYTSGVVKINSGGSFPNGTDRSSTGTYTETLQASDSNGDLRFYASADCSIDNVSVIEVDANGNPINILDGGRRESQTNLLTYSEDFDNAAWVVFDGATKNTANQYVAPDGNTTAESINFGASATSLLYQAYTFTSGTTYTLSVWAKTTSGEANFRLRQTDSATRYSSDLTATTEWQRFSFTSTSVASIAGNIAFTNESGGGAKTIVFWGAMLNEGMGPSDRPAFEYIPTTSSTVTVAENVDESVLWSYGGRYSNLATAGQNYLPHVLNEPSATQYLLNSATPANQTTGSLSTGDYVLWMNGTGSVSATDNTGTSDAGGNSASEGSPLTFTVSGAGTIDIAITGSVDEFQLEGGSVPTTFISSAGSTATRPATDYTATPTISDYLRFRISPNDTSSAQVWFSDGTSKIGFDGTNVYVTDGTNTASAAQAIAMGDEVGWDATTGKLYFDNSVIATNASVSITWGATIQIGADVSGGSPVTVTNGGLTDWYTLSTDPDLTDSTWRTP